jgi:ribosomal protein S18 acetylase RimI-like enzyme
VRRDEYEIRPLTIGDLPLMRAIEEASFSTPWPGNAYESELTTNRLARYVGAWRGGELLGFGGIWLMVDEAHVTTIAVAPALRGEGCSSSCKRHVVARRAWQHLMFGSPMTWLSGCTLDSDLQRQGEGFVITKRVAKMRSS